MAELQDRAVEAADARSARLKQAIDTGRTADKVPGFDPGAAPLGTDDESGGAPLPGGRMPSAQPSTAAADMAADPEGNDRAHYRQQDRLISPLVIALVVLAAIAIVAVATFV